METTGVRGEEKGPFCQSCGVMLAEAMAFGTDEHGQRVNDYCALCFRDGQFVDRQVTPDEMRDRIARRLMQTRQLPAETAQATAADLVTRLGRWVTEAQGVVRNWWLLALRGAALILVGMLLIVRPVESLLSLVILIGIAMLLFGVTALIAGLLRTHGERRSWGLVLEGALGALVGAIILTRPGIGGTALYGLVIGWAIASGIAQIVTAGHLGKHFPGRLSLGIAGVLSVVFGVLLIISPPAGVIALAWLMGIYAMAFGILQVGLGIRLHGLGADLHHRPMGPLPA